jgi:hypothetical protein
MLELTFKAIIVVAQPRDGAEPVTPLNPILKIRRDGGFHDLIFARGGEALARLGQIKRDVCRYLGLACTPMLLVNGATPKLPLKSRRA